METELGLDGACEDGPPPQHACIGFNYGTDSNLSVDEAAAAVEARSTSSVSLSAQRFMDAARIGDARTVSVYIAQYPMNVNSKEPLTGVTALMVAAAARQPHIVRLLLQAGADTAVCDHAGDSVVEWAVSDDSAAARSVMDLLIASPWPGLEPRLLKVLELCLSDSLPALFELVLFALSSLFVRKFLDSHPYDDPESLGHESALATQGRLGESFSIPIRAAQVCGVFHTIYLHQAYSIK